MNHYNNKVYFLTVLCLLTILISCFSQKINTAKGIKKIEIVGVATIEGKMYKSIYTNNSIDTVLNIFLIRLKQESSKQNTILLFYDDLLKTPKSSELSSKEKIVNKNLMGGIEKHNGEYYFLTITEGDLKRKKIND